jgi:HEAT repeat protein
MITKQASFVLLSMLFFVGICMSASTESRQQANIESNEGQSAPTTRADRSEDRLLGYAQILQDSADFRELRDAAVALANIDTPQAHQALIRALGAGRSATYHVACVLEDLSVPEAYPILVKVFQGCKAKGWRDVAHRLASAIGTTRDPDAFDFLVESIHCEDSFYGHSYIRAGAALGLAHSGDEKAKPLLEGMILNNDSADYGAAEGLAFLKSDASVPVLVKALQEEGRPTHRRVRYLKALAQIGNPVCLEPLLELRENSDMSWQYDYSQTLGKFADKRATPILLKIFEQNLQRVRGEGSQAERNVDPLKQPKAETEKPLYTPQRLQPQRLLERTVSALSATGSELAIDPIVSALRDPQLSLTLKRSMVFHMTRHSSPVSIGVVVAAAKDPAIDESLQMRMIMALGKYDSPAARQGLEEIVKTDKGILASVARRQLKKSKQ